MKNEDKKLICTDEIDYFTPLPSFESVQKYRETLPPMSEFKELDEKAYRLKIRNEALNKFKKRFPNGAVLDIEAMREDDNKENKDEK